MEKSAKELMQYSGNLFNYLLDLHLLGEISKIRMEIIAESLNDVRGILSQKILEENKQIDIIKKDAVGYLPLIIKDEIKKRCMSCEKDVILSSCFITCSECSR